MVGFFGDAASSSAASRERRTVSNFSPEGVRSHFSRRTTAWRLAGSAAELLFAAVSFPGIFPRSFFRWCFFIPGLPSSGLLNPGLVFLRSSLSPGSFIPASLSRVFSFLGFFLFSWRCFPSRTCFSWGFFRPVGRMDALLHLTGNKQGAGIRSHNGEF